MLQDDERESAGQDSILAIWVASEIQGEEPVMSRFVMFLQAPAQV